MHKASREHSQVGDLVCEQNRVLSELLGIVQEQVKWMRSTQGLATRKDLQQQVNKIMSAISEFSGRVKAYNDKISAAVDGVSTDVEELKAKITELQNSPGAITPEDQASLDAIETHAADIAAKIEALDLSHPPTPPPS